MRVFFFKSQLARSINAFCESPAGRNLPTEYAPWRALNGGASLLVGLASVMILEAIRWNGFYVLTDDLDIRT